MARQISKRPPSTGTRATTPTPSLGFLVSTRITRRKHTPPPSPAEAETIEERLIAKANAADGRDRTGQRDLGAMSREELLAALSGDS